MSSQHTISERHLPVEYGEIAILIVLTFLGGVCIYPSNLVTNFLIPEVLTSVAYSQTIGTALLLLCSIRAFALVCGKLRGESSQKTIDLTFALVGSLLVVIYGALFSYVGFYVATVTLLFVLSYYLEDKEERSFKRSALFTVATTVAVSVIFKLFKIYLPPALLI